MAGQESQRWPAQVYTDQARNHSTAMFAGRYDTVSTEGSGLCEEDVGSFLARLMQLPRVVTKQWYFQ